MNKALLVFGVMIALSPVTALGQIWNVSSEATLDAALNPVTGAQPGDTINFTSNITVSAAKEFPNDVIVEGNGFILARNDPGTGGALLSQNGEPNVVVRNLELATNKYGDWTIACGSGGLRFENCHIKTRLFPTGNGRIELIDSTHTLRIPKFSNSEFTNPIGVYTNGAVFAATNTFFDIGWQNTSQPDHWDNPLFGNWGGDPVPTTLWLNGCTITSATDDESDSPARHITAIVSDNTFGASHITTVANCAFILEASSIFRTTANGTVTSRHNLNAGMLRDPLVMKGTTYPVPNFYSYRAGNNAVLDKTGDITETNPFVDAPNGDFRLVSTSDAATGSSTGGPIGAQLGVVNVDHNAFNLELTRYTSVDDIAPVRTEQLFDGWRLAREVNDQFFYRNGAGLNGSSARLEVQDTFDETGGSNHDVFVTHSIYQTFVTVPGKIYTISAWSFRNESSGGPPYTWADNGSFGNTILGVADGVEPNPNNLDAQTIINGAEETWTQGTVVIQALSNHLTVHLVHRTNGSWNYSDWDSVTISAAAAPVTSGVEEFSLYR